MTNQYQPDNWVVIYIKNNEPHYRVLAGWSGSYTYGSSWRMNSGITSAAMDGDYFLFYGETGSVYRCHKDSYCLRMNNAYIWQRLKELHGSAVDLMDENTDWLKVDWLLKK